MLHRPQAPVVIVAGLSEEDRGIGYKNQLLWHVPEDLQRFKKLTLGHPIIMGRKTFESILTILGKPLPGRTSIVLTRDTEYTYPGVQTAHSLTEALRAARETDAREIHIGGGAELYTEALPYTTRLHLTLFAGKKPADAFFPSYAEDFTIVETSDYRAYEGTRYRFIDLIRKTPLSS